MQLNDHSGHIYTRLGARSFHPHRHFLLPSPPSTIPTIPMERDNSPQRFEEVDGPPAAQRHRIGDRAFTGSGRRLRTGGISIGSLRPHHVLPRAQASSSGPMVERTEEQALVRATTADVEGRANVLLRQLEDTNHRGVGKFSSLLFPSFLLLHLFSNSEWNLVCQR
jgi:hypothetical protein